jgi:phosphopantothenoylcysteine decarboxylase / phosphopantothenate---cysteine ligase
VSGPTKLDPPPGVDVERVRSAVEMSRAVLQRARDADAVIMAAAVADYMPDGGMADRKIAKTDQPLTLSLVRTPDILLELGRARGAASRPVLVGFAAETGDPRPRARQKLEAKQVDLIVANDVSRSDAGFDTDTNAAVLISADGEVEEPLQLKTELAGKILDRVEALLNATPEARGASRAARESGAR